MELSAALIDLRQILRYQGICPPVKIIGLSAVLFFQQWLPTDNSSDSCPQVIPGGYILVPNGVDQIISFQAKNLPPLDYTTVMVGVVLI